MNIGQLKVKSPYFLAPLAGYTDLVFRSIIRQFNCGVIYTEMVNATGLARNSKNTPRIMDIAKDDHPIGIQLFGKNPDDFAVAVQMAEQAGADIIDINCGCPAPKVVKSGGGSALMREPQLLQQIVKTVVKVATKPVSIKLRSGWDFSCINASELAKIAEGEGVSAVAIHARTRSQGFSGEADWSVIKEVKDAVSIPVIGNGDVRSQADADRMQAETGCDYVMIGRAAVQFFIPEEHRISKLIEHMRLLVDYKNPDRFIEMRKFVPFYTKALPEARNLRKIVNEAKTLDEFLAMIKS